VETVNDLGLFWYQRTSVILQTDFLLLLCNFSADIIYSAFNGIAHNYGVCTSRHTGKFHHRFHQ